MDLLTALLATVGRGIPVRRAGMPEGAVLRFLPAQRVTPPQDPFVIEGPAGMVAWQPSREDVLATDWREALDLAQSVRGPIASHETAPMFGLDRNASLATI